MLSAMTTRDDAPTLIYAPMLRRELVRRPLPPVVRFLDPGLPATAADDALYHPQNYPLSPERAARVLEELLAVGEALMAGAVGGTLSARMIQEQSRISSREKADINRFATSGGEARADSDEDPRISVQKVLLLAWDLEQRLLEIADLRQELARAVKPLAENLHGAPDDDVLKEFARALPEDLEALTTITPAMTPDWRLTFSAMAAFLPPGALLVTCHDGMRDAMADAGLLQPLPEETAVLLTSCPGITRSGLLRAKAPVWKILGHSRESENSPWLNAAPEIIVAPAGLEGIRND